MAELSLKYSKDSKTLRKYFNQLASSRPVIATINPKIKVNVCLDTTFFGWGKKCLAVYLFRDGRGCNLYWKYGVKETVRSYIEALHYLKNTYKFNSFTIDNKTGLVKALRRYFPDTPIQLCLFHAIKAANKYLGRRPQTKCGVAIQKLSLKLIDLNKQQFIQEYKKLVLQHQDFIQERNHLGGYKHQEVRSALTSLWSNFPYLFTYLAYPQLNIPKTNNTLEGYFGQMKSKVKLHRSLSRQRKEQMLNMVFQEKLRVG